MFESWAQAVDQLADELSTACATPDLWQPPAGPYELDLRALAIEEPDWVPDTIFPRVVFDSAKFVSFALRHGHAVATLVRHGEVYVSPWTLLRAQLEACGRLGWILEPHDAGVGIGPRRRTARYFMEMLCSVCYERETLKALRSPQADGAKRLRAHATCEIDRLFGVTLEWRGQGSELDWVIGPDRYASLAGSTERFATHMIPGLSPIYGVLSGYSHPSLRFLQQLLVEDTDASGLRTMTWRSDRSVVHWQCRTSCIPMYRATTLVFSYLGGPQTRLEAAMDRCETALAAE